MTLTRKSSHARARMGIVLGLLGGLAMPLAAQQQTDTTAGRRDTTQGPTRPYPLPAMVVTATRTEKQVFDVPKPVSVVDRTELREQSPNTAADLFRDLPGLDVSGVGLTQVRPSIRGQEGQRILLLEDGLRLNNSRRQQSFGEVPALVDVTGLDRVEIVRGPASVLYGTDAIGGVINLISRRPTQLGLHGSLGYRYTDRKSVV